MINDIEYLLSLKLQSGTMRWTIVSKRVNIIFTDDKVYKYIGIFRRRDE